MTTARSDFQWKRNVSVWRVMLFLIILIWLLSFSCNNNALQHVWQTFGNFHCKRAVDLLWQAYVEATPPVFCINAFPVFGKTHHNLLVNDQGVILSRFVWPLDTSFESCFLQNVPPEMPKNGPNVVPFMTHKRGYGLCGTSHYPDRRAHNWKADCARESN